MMAALALSAHSLAYAQKASELPQQPITDILVMKVSPGRWWYDLRGNVRSVESVMVKLEEKDGQMRETQVISHTFYFDRRGLETETIDSKEGRTLNKYDAQGKVLEMNMSLAGVPHLRHVYRYDIPRRKVTTEIYYFGSDGLYGRDVTLYDEHWNELRSESESVRNNVDEPPYKEVVIYTNTYDSKGRLTGLAVRREGRAINYSLVDEYDASGRLVKSTHCVYDDSSGALTSKSLLSYDRRSYLISGLRYDGRGRLTRRDTYTREFDQRGNWINETRVSRSNEETGSFTLITRRKLTYY